MNFNHLHFTSYKSLLLITNPMALFKSLVDYFNNLGRGNLIFRSGVSGFLFLQVSWIFQYLYLLWFYLVSALLNERFDLPYLIKHFIFCSIYIILFDYKAVILLNLLIKRIDDSFAYKVMDAIFFAVRYQRFIAFLYLMFQILTAICALLLILNKNQFERKRIRDYKP